jgi:hypothetical protein
MEKVTCANCGEDNIINAKYCSRCGHALPQITTEVISETVQQPTKEKGNKKKKLISTIVSVIAFGLAYGAVQYFFFGTPSLDKQLNLIASEINKSCPMMIDKETQFDNAVAMPDNVFQYNYTLVNIVKGTVDTVAIRNYIMPLATNNAKTNPEMKYQRDNKITLKYYYMDKNGDYLFSFAVTPKQYAN